MCFRFYALGNHGVYGLYHGVSKVTTLPYGANDMSSGPLDFSPQIPQAHYFYFYFFAIKLSKHYSESIVQVYKLHGISVVQ